MTFSAICVVIFISLFYSNSFARAIGLYQSHQSGDWNDFNTWEQWVNSAWVTLPVVSPTLAKTASGIQSTNTTKFTQKNIIQ